MPINQITLGQITSELQSLGSQFNALMNRVGLLKVDVVDGIGLANLQATPYNLALADAQAVMNSITDMWHFFQVYQGLWYVNPGGSLNAGVPAANDATHFGYPFNLNVSKTAGLGY